MLLKPHHSTLYCLYMKADVLTNKMTELKTKIAEYSPLITAVTKVIPALNYY